MNTTPIAYTIPDACRVCGLGRSKIYEFIKEGRLRTRKAGRRTLILHSDLVALIESLEAA